MRNHLVILRCGRTSLHPHWLRDAPSREFDLVLCPYQEVAPDPEADWQSAVYSGQKWNGLYRFLTEWPDWRRYAYIWLPDDDLLTDAPTIDALFSLSTRFETKISAPSLTENSFFSHVITMHNRSFFARAVAFIEVMMPCLRRDVLELLLPTIATSKTGYGWGLDYVWAQRINHENMVIFDAIQVRHTRPMGGAHDPALHRETEAEMRGVLSQFQATEQSKVLGAYDGTGRLRAADSQLFLLDYLNGYRYLIARDAALLEHLIRLQHAELPPPEGAAPAAPNLAFNKPAQLSSQSEGGSRTAFEQEPWWQIDLGADHAIGRVVIQNSKVFPENCTRMTVSGSTDGINFTMYAAKLDAATFITHEFKFSPAFAARFVRVTMIGEGGFHLEEVEVYEQ